MLFPSTKHPAPKQPSAATKQTARPLTTDSASFPIALTGAVQWPESGGAGGQFEPSPPSSAPGLECTTQHPNDWGTISVKMAQIRAPSAAPSLGHNNGHNNGHGRESTTVSQQLQATLNLTQHCSQRRDTARAQKGRKRRSRIADYDVPRALPSGDVSP